MVGNRIAGMAAFLTLCTFVSAIAQTTISDTRPPEQFRVVDASLAQQLSLSPNTEEQRQIARRFVDEKLAVWQKRLKLEDWHVSVVMTRRDDLKPRTLGGIRWDKGKKSAVMAVQDVSDYRLPFNEMLADMEFTVIHELVHLELASLPRSEASRSNEEYAVNQIAEALLRLDRQR